MSYTKPELEKFSIPLQAVTAGGPITGPIEENGGGEPPINGSGEPNGGGVL